MSTNIEMTVQERIDGWYFTLKIEGPDIPRGRQHITKGPFKSEKEANRVLDLYLDASESNDG